MFIVQKREREKVLDRMHFLACVSAYSAFYKEGITAELPPFQASCLFSVCKVWSIFCFLERFFSRREALFLHSEEEINKRNCTLSGIPVF